MDLISGCLFSLLNPTFILLANLQIDSSTAANVLDMEHLPQHIESSQDSSQQVRHSNLGCHTLVPSNEIHGASDLLMAVTLGAEVSKTKISELASEAMKELMTLALVREPLWQVDMASNTEVLNEIEYMRQFGDINATLMEIVRMVEVRESQSLPSSDMNNSEFSVRSQHEPRELGSKPVSSEASREVIFVKMNPASIIKLLMDMVGSLFQ